MIPLWIRKSNVCELGEMKAAKPWSKVGHRHGNEIWKSQNWRAGRQPPKLERGNCKTSKMMLFIVGIQLLVLIIFKCGLGL